MNNITLKINGKKYNRWKEVTVNKSLFSITGFFNLGGVDIFPNDFKKWGFKLGDACTVEIDNQTIINGYIEDIPINYDGTNHDIQIGGRDKTADLVDCSFIETNQEWKNLSIAQLTRTLCNPFSIDVAFDSSIPVSELIQTGTDFKYLPGMTVFEMLKPILDTKGILPVSYGDGKLTLTRSGSDKANDVLRLGKNIKSGSINQSVKDRFSTYIVRGQSSGDGIFGQPKDYTEPEGIANDSVIGRY
jgi:prophage tail gpP-like protein